jgi:hypothetical protein
MHLGSQKTRKDNVVFPWLHLRKVKLKLQQKQQPAGLSLKIHFGGPKGGKRGRRRRFWATSIVSPSQNVKKKKILFIFSNSPTQKKDDNKRSGRTFPWCVCAGKNDETGKMSDMWCAEVIFNAHHRQEKKTQKGKM